ncbi:MAG: hypothetical protein V4650_15495 [Pseudomonadota bacterium]
MSTISLPAASAPNYRSEHERYWRAVRAALHPAMTAAGPRALKSASPRPKQRVKAGVPSAPPRTPTDLESSPCAKPFE